MATEKTGFVLYFDACKRLDALEAAQRGWLLTALCAFARACAQDEHTDMLAVLAQFPEMTPETHMACCFLCETVLRDTIKWRDRKNHYVRAAAKRQEQRKNEGATDDAWKYVEK